MSFWRGVLGVFVEVADRALVAARVGALRKEMLRYRRSSRASNTLRNYRSDWRDFARWCRSMGIRASSPTVDDVCMYITHLASAGKKAATIRRRIAGLRHFMDRSRSGFQNAARHEAVKLTLEGIVRSIGSPVTQAKVMSPMVYRRLIESIDTKSLRGKRDKALILIWLAGAMRRSELREFCVEDIVWKRDSVHLWLGRSKTDQFGNGRCVPIHRGRNLETCPVNALREWLDASEIKSGAIFRSIDQWGNIRGPLNPYSCAWLYKARLSSVQRCTRGYSGHSFRRTAISVFRSHGVNDLSIMDVTGHRSPASIHRYSANVKDVNFNQCAPLCL